MEDYLVELQRKWCTQIVAQMIDQHSKGLLDLPLDDRRRESRIVIDHDEFLDERTLKIITTLKSNFRD